MSTRLERIVGIDREIRAGNYPTAASLAAMFEVSERTIYLDREFMITRLDAPMATDPDTGGWFYADSAYVLPAIMVSEGELLAFFLGRAVVQQYLGTSFERPLRSALEKIARYLPAHVRMDLAEASRHYTIRAGATLEVNPRLMLDLERAIRERRQVWMLYYTASRGERNRRTVNPYHLYNARGDWYLIAYDHWRGNIRNFHLGRIEEWQVLDQHFEADTGFSAADYISQGFLAERGEVADVVIRFDEYQARWVRERPWHPSQAPLEELPEGGVILRFRSGGLEEIKRRVLSCGGHAEVLEPPELRAAVAAEVGKLAEMYLE
ncbi:MAG: WYL domain-containing protein [Anaerolineae bacterium]